MIASLEYTEVVRGDPGRVGRNGRYNCEKRLESLQSLNSRATVGEHCERIHHNQEYSGEVSEKDEKDFYERAFFRDQTAGSVDRD
jgi:hypothetical protein